MAVTWLEQVDKRTRNGKKCVDSLNPRHFAVDVTIGAIHYKDNIKDDSELWKEIDNIFEPALAPWDWQMFKAGYHIRIKEDFTAGQIIEFEKQDETVQFQPMSLEWTNDLGQIQQISMPQDVVPVITNPEVDLLPAVGVPSHQGTIRWDNAYGEGLDFEWKCTSTRLVKILEIASFSKLSVPEQYILDGGNPVLRLNLIFASSSDMDIYVNNGLWDKNTKKHTFNTIEFKKGSDVLWGFVPLMYWGSGTDEENNGQSVATLDKRGNKLYVSIRVPYTWLQNAIYPVFIDTDVDEKVEASADDVEEYTAFTTTSTRFRVEKGLVSVCECAARFITIDIAQGTTIDVAYLTLRASADKSSTALLSNLACEDVDDATQIISTADFDGRSLTVVTAWDNIGSWTLDTDYNSPSIVSPIQAVINRVGWVSGNAINVFWKDDGSSSYVERWAYSYDTDTTYCPRLHIEYAAAAAAFTPGLQPGNMAKVIGVLGKC